MVANCHAGRAVALLEGADEEWNEVQDMEIMEAERNDDEMLDGEDDVEPLAAEYGRIRPYLTPIFKAKSAELVETRSLLYRSQFLQLNTHFAAFFEMIIYKICILLHRSKFGNFAIQFVSNCLHCFRVKSCEFCDFRIKFVVFSTDFHKFVGLLRFFGIFVPSGTKF